jgi:uncharacterized protein YlaN (UPF0358 family)
MWARDSRDRSIDPDDKASDRSKAGRDNEHLMKIIKVSLENIKLRTDPKQVATTNT